ncbi:MAG: formylglycine-generating enzyme family protein [Kiritimatiellae bacterium]|nr:formylglycine-generating enzyme family protein [Kiritimatiellia bacterium]
MNKTNSIALCATIATAVAAHSAVPVVTPVSMTQADNRVVTITYTLSDAPAVITLDVQTNANPSAAANDPGWTSIGGEAIWNAVGDVWKEVAAGSRTITWRPDHSWPDHVIENGGARAVVTAWALENTPDYMVVDLAAANTVRYYPGVDYLPKSGFDQPGAAVTNNPAYKTTKLLMRKIMASGIEWTMGSADGETQRNANETPHVATLANNYYIGVFEVTQAQWANINPGSSATASNVGETRPMDNLCYNEIRNDPGTSHASHAAYDWPNDPHPSSFLGLLRAKTGLDFDLPSEAQWEFAARSGNGSGHWNDGSAVLNTDADANLGNLGCYNANTPGGTAVVGSYAPSAWGLYDMHGNVFEWCLDWYEDDISRNGGSANIDPSNSTKTLSGATKTGEWDMLRVFCGGAYGSAAKGCRAAYRGSNPEWFRQPTYGFRVVCTAGLR